ncbi:hypothetical protein [Ferrovibrio sp.]|uniref:hypothetical protein n=1 Tax=Ferrovibrio sp. TaxID=1917215 RepID=UPI0025BD6C49|nr:hypothetical protein [Ferrovibrio sp.]
MLTILAAFGWSAILWLLLTAIIAALLAAPVWLFHKSRERLSLNRSSLSFEKIFEKYPPALFILAGLCALAILI